MATTSSQEFEKFFREQKEKLSRDRHESNYFIQQEQKQNYRPVQNNFVNPQNNPPSNYNGNTYSPKNQQKENDFMNENFFDRFGSYENKKTKLNNELNKEYNEYLNKKMQGNQMRENQESISNEFYATLPLKGMVQRYGSVSPSFRKGSESPNHIIWSKNLKEPDIKPYSKHSESQDNLKSNVGRYQKNEPKSQSYFDVSSVHRELSGYQDSQSASTNFLNNPNINNSTNYVPYQPLNSALDPTLNEILRRPPVGISNQALNSFLPISQSNPVMPTSGLNTNMNLPLYQTNMPKQNYPSSQNIYQNMPSTQYSDRDSKFIAKPNSPVMTTGGLQAFNFTEDQQQDSKQSKAREYQQELARQVREKQIQKQREKQQQELLDKKLLAETANFNPFGRGGGGAPLKDKDGNIIANLSQAKNAVNIDVPNQPSSNQFSSYNPTQYQLPTQRLSAEINLPSNRDFEKKSRTGSDDQSFARGGNGIFGEGKTDDQKKQEEKYKAELQKQIEEKRIQKEEEKRKLRLEEEREQKRIEEEQRRLKAELEDEERKKREKEDASRAEQERAKKLAEEKRLQAKLQRNTIKPNATNSRNQQQQQSNPPPADDLVAPPENNNSNSEFRSNSPPVPAVKKIDDKKPPNNTQQQNSMKSYRRPTANSIADYYNTESRLNVSSPNRNPSDDVIPKKPMLRKIASRPSSQSSSNSELIMNLQNLKKHLHSEQIEVENQLYNSSNRSTVGQLSDLHKNILNVKTPTSDHQRQNFDNPQKTYRKDSRTNDKDIFSNDLQQEARSRNANRFNLMNSSEKNLSSNNDLSQQLASQNQQRLKKLRDIEADNLSMADPNEVLDQFVSKSKNRHPSATTILDDAWLR